MFLVDHIHFFHHVFFTMCGILPLAHSPFFLDFDFQPPRPEISMVLVTAVYTSRVGSECWDPLGLPDGTTIVTRYWP